MAGELHASGTAAAPRPRWARYAHALSPRLLIVALGVLCALLMALPGVTITTTDLSELFYTLDGAHRTLWGQVPNLDFHSSLGPLVFYLPAMGHRLAGGFGGAMPLALAAVLVLLTPLIAHALASRLRPFLALLLGGYLVLLLAAPIRLGEAPTALSFAMFYDRIGWVALAALLVMYLRPVARSTSILLDASCAALLTLLLVYTKITYGLTALGFLLFMLSDARQRRWAGLALVVVAIALLIVELPWGGTTSYFRDILQTAAVSGLLGGDRWALGEHVSNNATELLLLGLIAGVALWRAWRIRDALFFALCAIGGLWIISHNTQDWGIFSLSAAAAVAAEKMLRRLDEAPDRDPGPWINQAGIKLVFLALTLPMVVHCTIAMALHTTLAVAGGGREVALPNMGGIRLADLGRGNEHSGWLWYLGTVEDGLDGLSQADGEPGPIVVLGRANPFSPSLDLEPPRGDMPELRWERTVDATHHPPPETLLADAQTVMEPVTAGGVGSLGDLYLPYVRERYDLVAETDHWRIFRRNEQAEDSAAARAGPAG